MSIKIHTAWEYSGNIFECFQFLMKLRSGFKIDLKEFLSKIPKTKGDRNSFNKFYSLLVKINESPETNILKTCLEFTIHPYENKIILVAFGLKNWQKNVQNLLTDSKLKDFSYWDNTDKDLNVSKNEWDQRKYFWDNFNKDYSEYYKFMDKGFNFSVFNKDDLFNIVKDLFFERC